MAAPEGWVIRQRPAFNTVGTECAFKNGWIKDKTQTKQKAWE